VQRTIVARISGVPDPVIIQGPGFDTCAPDGADPWATVEGDPVQLSLLQQVYRPQQRLDHDSPSTPYGTLAGSERFLKNHHEVTSQNTLMAPFGFVSFWNSC